MAKAHAAVMSAPKLSRVSSLDPVEKGWTNKALAKAGVNLDGGIFRAKKPSRLAQKSNDGAASHTAAPASKLNVVPATASTQLAQTVAKASQSPRTSKAVGDRARVDAFEEQQTISADDGSPPHPVLVETSYQEGSRM